MLPSLASVALIRVPLVLVADSFLVCIASMMFYFCPDRSGSGFAEISSARQWVKLSLAPCVSAISPHDAIR